MTTILERDCEFIGIARKLNIDLGAAVDPQTELEFAEACRRCTTCGAKDKCHRALAGSFSPLRALQHVCPNVEVFVDLLCRQPVD
jgi:hypothetical protein